MPKKIDGNGSSQDLSITVAEMQTQVDRYKTERYNKIVPPLPTDSRAVWVSKRKISEVFDSNPFADGIRIYYGVISTEFYREGCHNLLFVSTKASGGENIDQLAEDNWVLVAENFGPGIVAPELAICPPPTKPCGGNQIKY